MAGHYSSWSTVLYVYEQSDLGPDQPDQPRRKRSLVRNGQCAAAGSRYFECLGGGEKSLDPACPFLKALVDIQLPSLCRKRQRYAVHAVPQTGGCWSIIENVS